MKKQIAFVVMMFIGMVALCQTNTITISDPQPVIQGGSLTIPQMLIAIAVPMILAGFKAFIPKIPKRLIPWLAPAIGAVLDIALNATNVAEGNGSYGAALGALGIGIRELFRSAVPSTPAK